MVTIISRSLHSDTEFSKAKDVEITKQFWCCEQIATRFKLAQGTRQAISQQKTEMYTYGRCSSHAVMQVRSYYIYLFWRYIRVMQNCLFGCNALFSGLLAAWLEDHYGHIAVGCCLSLYCLLYLLFRAIALVINNKQ